MFFELDKYKDNVALISDDGQIFSYGELYESSCSLSTVMKTRKLVFQLCENSIGSVLGYASFLNAGVVPVMLSAGIDKNLLHVLINTYQPAYLWIPKILFSECEEFRIVYEGWGYFLLETDMVAYPVNDDLALLLTTSGSTGSPKFVRQSYDNIRANTESIIEYLELDSTERPITTLPMNYTYGLSIINTHLSVGATILLTNKTLMQKDFWTFFKKQESTSFGGVPYTYEMLDKLRFFRMDLPFLRTMTQAGGKLTPQLHEKFARYAEDTGKKFVVMYGQCEATARMGYLPAEKAVKKKGSMGIAIPGGTFRLIDIEGNEIEKPYVTGELVYKGENVTLGYAERGEDLIKGDERNGVLMTGDMAEFDEDGYYYIVGRKKRFLKIYGNRVNLDEVERLIKGKFEIDIACGGVDDHMVLFLTDETKAADVKSYVVSTTKLNPSAFKTIIIGEIPKNDSGKIQYTKLEKYYREPEL